MYSGILLSNLPNYIMYYLFGQDLSLPYNKSYLIKEKLISSKKNVNKLKNKYSSDFEPVPLKS